MARAHGTRASAARVLAAGLAAAAALGPASADAPKRDFRGLEPGMSVAQAVAAAGHNGFVCETTFTALTTCRDTRAVVTLKTTGRNGNRVYELQVVLLGHYDAPAMVADLTRSYALAPTSVTNVYATAAGQQLMLLETGGTQTVFYLVDERVLRDDSAALPPPKL